MSYSEDKQTDTDIKHLKSKQQQKTTVRVLGSPEF